MINALIPLVFGLLFIFRPEIFIKKDIADFDQKKAKFVMIGKGLLVAAFLLFLSSVLMRIGAPNDNAIVSGSVRDNFVQSFKNGCIQTAMNDSRRNTLNIPENVINEYCLCSADSVVGHITYGELKLVNANPAKGEQIIKQKVEFAASCDRILQGAI